MARYLRVTRLAFVSGMGMPNYDKVLTTPPPHSENDDTPIGGWKAILRIFQKDKYGEHSPEYIGMTNTCVISVLVGAVYGTTIYARNSFNNFIENNEATKFLNQWDAKRKLQDSVILGMGKGGLKWGIKIGGFCSVFIVSTTLIGAYLGGHGITEYVLAGILTGTLYKLNLGIRGAIAGAIVGSSIGTTIGIAFNFLFYLSGYSLREIHQIQKEFHQMRKSYAQEGLQQDMADEYGEHHQELGKNLDQMPDPEKK